MSVRTAACCVALLFFCGAPAFGQGIVDAQPGVPQRLGSGSAADLHQQPVAVPGPSIQAHTTTVEPRQESPDSQEKKEAGGQEKLAALEQTVTELTKKFTVVTADENFKLILGGTITADFLFNSA